MKIYILIPVFEDFSCILILYKRLKNVFKNYDLNFLIIDDGSYSQLDIKYKLSSEEDIKFLTLSQNVGHQRSIAIGLCFLSELNDGDFTIVMDGDGEDNPEDAIKLVNQSLNEGKDKIVFARRDVRSEPLLFKLGYIFYRILFRLLTGKNIKFGNFSVIPCNLLKRIIGIPEIWNHYASAILMAGIPKSEVSTKRGGRIYGRPKMNMISLVMHGLNSISIFCDILLLRVFLFSSVILTIKIPLSLYLLILKKTSYETSLYLFTICTISIMFWIGLLVTLFLKLSLRSSTPCIPINFWKSFIKED